MVMVGLMVSMTETNGTDGAGRAALERDLVQLSEDFRRAAMALVGPGILPPDLTMQQVRVVMLVAAEPGLTSAQLAHHLRVSAPTASGLVERLVDKGFVRRVEDEADRRVRRLALTEQAQAMVLELDALNTTMIGRLLPLLDDEDVRVLVAAHRAILRALASVSGGGGFCG